MHNFDHVHEIDHLLREVLVVPVPVAPLAVVQEADARGGVERSPPALLAELVHALELCGREGEAEAADFVLHGGHHLPRALGFLADAAHAIDGPLEVRVEEGLEDAFILSYVENWLTAAADIAVMAICAWLAITAVLARRLRVGVEGGELVRAAAERLLRLPGDVVVALPRDLVLNAAVFLPPANEMKKKVDARVRGG